VCVCVWVQRGADTKNKKKTKGAEQKKTTKKAKTNLK